MVSTGLIEYTPVEFLKIFLRVLSYRLVTLHCYASSQDAFVNCHAQLCGMLRDFKVSVPIAREQCTDLPNR